MNLHWIHSLLFLALQSQSTYSWEQWNYSNFATDEWRDIWGFVDGPGGRRGHSMVLWDETKVVLFGGRDNEIHKPDVPKTYELIGDDGILKFETYDEKPVRAGYDPSSCQPKTECVTLENTTSSGGGKEICSYSWEHVLTDDMTSTQKERMEELCGFTTSGVYYNDVWMYDLACARFGDTACVNDGWRVLHPGARFGSCQNEDQSSFCGTPFARWGHSAIMIDNTTMFIYGGYSQECEDYCDDMWAFDFKSLDWQKVNVDLYPSPGSRWKSSMLSLNTNSEDGGTKKGAILFGGHRLWHGFAMENSEENLWQSTDKYEKGGFLSDLWILSHNDNTTSWVWSKQIAKETCISAPGLSWEERNDIRCNIYWPKKRSGHAAVFDKQRNGLWIHGGFTSHYPYPASSSPGSANGVKGQRKKGFIPFASHSYYLNDLWFYNISSGYWKELKQQNMNYPTKRTDHIMVLSGNILILHGGYSENHYFNETWYYYIDENRWLRKENHVHAFFPEECTDDIDAISKEVECIELSYPPPLQRSNQSTYTLDYQEILPYQQQPGYTPDAGNPLYFGIVHNATDLVLNLRRTYLDQEVYDNDGNRIWINADVPEGTPIAPNAATGPRQFAQLKQIRYNESLTLDIWEWCSSVEGEPTRGKTVDGLAGRSEKSIHIPQLRRQSPGWDGCRELRWKYPPSRTDHNGIYIDQYSILFLYGGVSYKEVDIQTGEHPSTPSLRETHETLVMDDLWILDIHSCSKNCSNHGTCTNGFCKCFPGYYGLDCSNVTCPGSVCYYDKENTQHCKHCCYDGYTHMDEDQEYLAGIRKIPCRHKDDMNYGIFTGNSNGICDGFGTCQCSPPFLGEDCSIRDCKNDCSFNGYCSVEFPNSRCICNEGYFGEYCQYIECLNNCTFPNGVCDHNTGSCTCEALYSPYNRSETRGFWQGADCSYLTPWCGCSKVGYSIILFIIVIFGFWIVII